MIDKRAIAESLGTSISPLSPRERVGVRGFNQHFQEARIKSTNAHSLQEGAKVATAWMLETEQRTKRLSREDKSSFYPLTLTLSLGERGLVRSHPKSPIPKQQHGMALLMVLFILAIATVAVVSMSTTRQLDIRRTENLLRSAQGSEYLYSLESWAAKTLDDDTRANKTDSFKDNWAQPLENTTTQGGSISAELTDLQGRFNLNNLIAENQPSEVDVKRFRRLLLLLEIKPGIIDALLDWMDADSDTRSADGGEDEIYFQAATPYRSANRPLADLSELLLIHGISQEVYAKLKPYVYVAAGRAPLNINTADLLLVRSLSADLSERDAELLVSKIRDKPFKSVEAFLQESDFADLNLDKGSFSVTSANFQLSATIQVGKMTLLYDTQFLRQGKGKISIVKRQRRSLEHG